MKKGKFKIEIYGFTVFVYILADVEKLDKFYRELRKKIKYPIDPDEGRAEGLVLAKDFDIHLLLAENKLSVSLITHEVVHIVYEIFEINNISLEESEENFALLTGYINERLFKIIEKLNCKII